MTPNALWVKRILPHTHTHTLYLQLVVAADAQHVDGLGAWHHVDPGALAHAVHRYAVLLRLLHHRLDAFQPLARRAC
jgi:hypothetical protein